LKREVALKVEIHLLELLIVLKFTQLLQQLMLVAENLLQLQDLTPRTQIFRRMKRKAKFQVMTRNSKKVLLRSISHQLK